MTFFIRAGVCFGVNPIEPQSGVFLPCQGHLQNVMPFCHLFEERLNRRSCFLNISNTAAVNPKPLRRPQIMHFFLG